MKNIKVITIFLVVAVGLFLIFKMNNQENSKSALNIDPISHASMILNWGGKALYTDPVGDQSLYAGKPDADIILLTDIHQDHFDVDILSILNKEKTIIIAPQAVVDLIPKELNIKVFTMNNGAQTEQLGFNIEAIPMYNLPKAEDSFHTKGRGNGYVIEKSGLRVYLSGDTSGIPEMRNLQNIDRAFVAMNLPFTMNVEEAANAVLAFKPKVVTPYHYRGTDGLSDINKFKALVEVGDPNIKVELINFYPE